MPGNEYETSPTLKASAATTKNQAPDIDIIMFQISAGMAKGASSRQKRCQAEKRQALLASLKSRGTVSSDWYMLKVMFQAWLVKMAKIAAHSGPSVLCGKRLRKNTTVKDR